MISEFEAKILSELRGILFTYCLQRIYAKVNIVGGWNNIFTATNIIEILYHMPMNHSPIICIIREICASFQKDYR